MNHLLLVPLLPVRFRRHIVIHIYSFKFLFLVTLNISRGVVVAVILVVRVLVLIGRGSVGDSLLLLFRLVLLSLFGVAGCSLLHAGRVSCPPPADNHVDDTDCNQNHGNDERDELGASGNRIEEGHRDEDHKETAASLRIHEIEVLPHSLVLELTQQKQDCKAQLHWSQEYDRD